MSPFLHIDKKKIIKWTLLKEPLSNRSTDYSELLGTWEDIKFAWLKTSNKRKQLQKLLWIISRLDFNTFTDIPRLPNLYQEIFKALGGEI